MHSELVGSGTCAPLNFAADRSNGGIWSNYARDLISQRLRLHEVDIRDARTLPAASALEQEGFHLEHAPLAQYDWKNAQWVRDVYMPAAVDLVRRLSGAAHAAAMSSVLIRDTGDAKAVPAAEFVHFDQSRESAVPFIVDAADETTRARYKRIKIFNVWRVLTPPPQDVPLALCDQRSLQQTDWVTGRTVSTEYPDGIAYVSSVFNPEQKWYYFSNVTPDDAIVFKGYDNDPQAPMGCLHGAFKHADLAAGTVPRASAEARVIAFFQA